MLVVMYCAFVFSMADSSVPERVHANDASTKLADSEEIQGTWVLVKTDFDRGWREGTRIVFRKGKLIATVNPNHEAVTYTQNEEKSPHTIALTAVNSRIALQYHLNGDKLRLCLAGATVTFKRDKAAAGGEE
jgi:uncharacterized protein (TIGR03067 family)